MAVIVEAPAASRPRDGGPGRRRPVDHGATHDHCRATLVFDIAEGEIEGTDGAGLAVAAIVDTPKVMTEGNWRLGMFVDERASDEQMEKLTAAMGGQEDGKVPCHPRQERGRLALDRVARPPRRGRRRRHCRGSRTPP